MTLGLVTAVLVPTTTGLRNLLGTKRFFLAGLALFAAGSLVTMLSPSITVLVIGSALLVGLGAVPMASLPWDWIGDRFSGRDRDLALVGLSLVVTIGGLGGSTIGGLITGTLGWRWAFAPELVAVAVVGVLVARTPISEEEREEEPVDWSVTALVVAGLVLAIGALYIGNLLGVSRRAVPVEVLGIELSRVDRSMVPTLIVLALAAVPLLLIRRHRRRHPEAAGASLVRTDLVRNRDLRWTVLVGVINGMVVAGFTFDVYLFIPLVFATGSIETSLTAIPLATASAIATAASFRLGRSIDQRTLVRIGLVVLGVGMVAFYLQLTPAMSQRDIVLWLTVMGAGAGVVTGQVFSMATSQARGVGVGTPNASYNAVQDLGYGLAVALFGTVFMAAGTARFVERALRLLGFRLGPDDESLVVSNATEVFQTLSNDELSAAAAQTPAALRPVLDDAVVRSAIAGMEAATVALGAFVALALVASIRLPSTRLS